MNETVFEQKDADVLVCGAGPAGFAAALRAAREGASVQLIEKMQAPGGIWTCGLLPWILDHQDKTGIMAELREKILAFGGHLNCQGKLTIPPEELKFILEELLTSSGIRIRYGTCVTSAERSGRKLDHVLTHSKKGCEAWRAKVYVDCTGDGDLAAFAGCAFDCGNDDGRCQPASLIAVVTGIDPAAVADYMDSEGAKQRIRALLRSQGVDPSYGNPSLFYYGNGLFAIMGHHAYGVRCDDPDSLTRAVIEGRKELHREVEALRRCGGIWSKLTILATSEQLGIREARRIRGIESAVWDGASPADQIVCTSHFGLDVHSLSRNDKNGDPEESKKFSGRIDIPYGALISADCDNLMMAGRCISGDFLAHSSYRVTGNAVPTGEAAGFGAARAAKQGIAPAEVTGLPYLNAK